MSYTFELPPLAIDAGDGQFPEYSAAAFRSALTGLAATSAAGASYPRSGALDLRALQVKLVGGRLMATAGPYIVGTPLGGYICATTDDPEIGTPSPADATNPRIDQVVLRIDDPDNGGGEERTATLELVTGTPAAIPRLPNPTGTEVWSAIARIDVPRQGAGSPAITDLRSFTSAAGGIVPIRNSNDLGSLGGGNGQVAFDLATGVLKVRTAAGWKNIVTENDTTWTTVPVLAPFRNYSEVPVEATRSGRTITIQGALAGDNLGSGIRQFAQLIPKFRPSGRHGIREVMQGSVQNRWMLMIGTDGACYVDRYGPGATAANTWYPFSATYLGD